MIALLLACEPEPADVDDPVVIEDTEDPVLDEPATVEEVLAQLPACESTEGNGRLRIEEGCADAVCVGLYAADVFDAAGPGDCEATAGYPGFISCWWELGLSISFRDRDVDGVIDTDSRNEGMYVYAPFDGTSADGLGADTSMSCFVDVYGTPDRVEFASSANGFAPSSFIWESLGFGVWDEYTPNDYGQDGRADYLYIAGAPDWEP